MTLPLDGYVRVSKVGGRGGEGFISPEVQERAIREWAERSGVEVVIKPHELNVSGGTMDRPVFNEIMERIRQGKSGGIVVYKTDRFARSVQGATTTLAEIGKHNARFASASEPTLDYSSPHGQAFLNMLFVFAEFVRSSIKESWAVTQRNAIERGIHISPSNYFGYDRVDGRLVPNGDGPTVREVFLRRGAGESWGSLAEWLDEVAPKPDGRLWTGQTVQRLCKKRVYRGEASRYVDRDVDGRGAIVNPKAHPALVTEAEWQAAQMNPRVAKGGRKDGRPLPLLSERIRCAGCRFSMSLGRGPKGELLYRCRGKHASGACPSPASVLADTIEEFVEGAVLAELDGVVRIVPSSADRDRTVERLEQARADLDGFRRDVKARRKLDEQWYEWLDSYLTAVRDAEAELDRLNAQVGAVSQGLTRDHYLALPQDDRREVLGGFIDTVIVRRSRGRGRNVDPVDRRARILWRGEAPPDLPRPRVSSPIVSFEFDDDVEAGVVATENSGERLQA
jgi:DNA invertase Pin-like site-specific DNA recombinase